MRLYNASQFTTNHRPKLVLGLWSLLYFLNEKKEKQKQMKALPIPECSTDFDKIPFIYKDNVNGFCSDSSHQESGYYFYYYLLIKDLRMNNFLLFLTDL